MPPAIEFRGFGLAHRRGHGDEVLFAGATLALREHGFWLFTGSSGGGKTSLLRLLAGLVEPREPAPLLSGELLAWGEPVGGGQPASLRGRTAAILQDEGLLDELSPRQNVELALRAAGRSLRLAPALLAQAGIEHPPERTAELSGGMRKRVAVARALAGEPRLLLCDEPTAGLDAGSARAIAELLHAAHDGAADRTTIVVTHDLATFTGLADGVLVLDRAAQSLRLEAPAFRPPLPPGVGSGAPPPHEDGPSLHAARTGLLQLAAIPHTLAEAVRRLPPVEFGETLRTVARCATEPVLFVTAASAVIGGLATFFALRNNPIEGGFESALLGGTGKVLCAVLVPLLAGFFFTARLAAGATARLGTMKRTNQIAALQTMGIRPADRLLVPLLWGMTLAMPLVTAAAVVAASLAAALAAGAVSGLGAAGWANAFFASLDAGDLRIVLGKAALSGALVALCCWHLGTGPKRSGAEVGQAVDAAIVLGMGLVLAVHAAATFACYA